MQDPDLTGGMQVPCPVPASFIWHARRDLYSMKIAIFQHEPTEPAGYLEQVFSEHTIPVEYIRLCETGAVPRTNATHLVFMGGPMSVNNEREFPYLNEEKELIRKSAKNRQRVLGICLGAQLIASAFGAPVYRSVPETGWHLLETVPESPGVLSRFPAHFPVFQLHGETFAIPYGGRLLCTGDRVKNQGFAIGSCLGLQFHLEMTGEIIRDWSRGLKRYDREKIARDTPRYLAESNRLCRIVAEDFAGVSRSRPA
jgi:GMP synthase-like glutamine amidotransferase